LLRSWPNSKKAISVAEFFEKNRQILGFDSAPRALITCVKEAVDNSLDACEDAGILPDIFVQIKRSGEYYQVIVEDNGPGIVQEEIGRVLPSFFMDLVFMRYARAAASRASAYLRQCSIPSSPPASRRGSYPRSPRTDRPITASFS